MRLFGTQDIQAAGHLSVFFLPSFWIQTDLGEMIYPEFGGRVRTL